jgi:hypothetical protein
MKKNKNNSAKKTNARERVNSSPGFNTDQYKYFKKGHCSRAEEVQDRWNVTINQFKQVFDELQLTINKVVFYLVQSGYTSFRDVVNKSLQFDTVPLSERAVIFHMYKVAYATVREVIPDEYYEKMDKDIRNYTLEQHLKIYS